MSRILLITILRYFSLVIVRKLPFQLFIKNTMEVVNGGRLRISMEDAFESRPS